MKKAIKINLSGIIFHIDEDAYEVLKTYLDTISRHFGRSQEGDEIMHDIESRIAELLQERLQKEEEVISLKLVKEVIEIMGEPEDIINNGEEQEQGKSSSGSKTSYGGQRRLYRDPDNAVISGVSAGLGAYFNIDPLIIRILFIVFAFSGASFIIYPILWIVLPKAETTGQKLEMKGEPVNVSNIEKKVREEYESAKENVKAAASKENVQKTKKAVSNFGNDLGKVLMVILKIFLIIIGTSLVILGIVVIVGVITGSVVGMHFIPIDHYNFSLADILSPFSDPVSITLILIAISLLFLIPLISMIYGIIKVIFSIKTRNKGLLAGSIALWVIALFMAIGILLIETGNYSDSGKNETSSMLKINSDTLYLDMNTSQEFEFETELVFDLDLETEWYLTEDLERIYGEVDIDIERSDDDRVRLQIEKRSKGKNWDEADRRASNLNYSYSVRENHLILDPCFYLDAEDKWRFPRVNLQLEIPEGTYIFIHKNTRNYLEDVYNKNHISDWRMGDKMWLMTEDGLELVE